MKVGTRQSRHENAKESEVGNILKHTAAVLKNMKTYQPNSPVLRKSLDILETELTSFLRANESLILLVRETSLVYGRTTIYSASDKMDNLAFLLYRDGIRLITFRDGISPEELYEFLSAVHEAREADPYQADLVTILWEKDLKHIGYRAVDAYLEDNEKQKIEQLACKCTGQATRAPCEDFISSSEFFLKELGLSPHIRRDASPLAPRSVTDTETRQLIREILDEDDGSLLKRCSEICLEIAEDPDTDQTFNNVVSFLGRICEWHVASGDLLAACSILSDLRTIAADEHTPEAGRASICDTIAKLGEGHRLRKLEQHFSNPTEARAEEIFAYLALMEPVAIEPLCNMLADCEQREVRYLLCRAISIVAHREPQRLQRFILDSRWYVVRNMVMILGMMGNAQVFPLLGSAARHTEPRVRKELARWLGRIGSEDGLAMLLELTDDEDKVVRLTAISGLREIASEKVRTPLEELIRGRAFMKRPLDERKEIFRCYGALGKGSLEFLRSVITGQAGHLDDKSRAVAAYGIALVEGGDARSLLEHLVETADGPLRSSAAEALAQMDSTKGLGEKHDVRALTDSG
jgi:hypothetical protein